MTKPTLSPSSSSSWGTLPDLLLAFAVNRHGTAAWDSIASELQKRTDDPSLSLTPQNCRLKYLDLKRRFNHDLDDKSDDAAASLLEELRKLRVAELRREVQRYDLNIELLEMKVKKMEEERERSVRDESESDLEKKSTRVQPESEAATAREPVAGGDLEKDQLSVNESNSTDLKAKKLRTAEKDPEPVRTGEDDARQDRTGQVDEPSELKSESDRKAVREDSCNGSSNSIKKSNRKTKPAGLIEPDTEFAGDEEEAAAAAKESSDVQSTASRSRKEEGKNKVRRGSRGGEREDQSGAVKATSAESQRLADFLRSIRAQKFGCVFQRRLRSQETSKYQKLILQHLDLETIETRLKEGWYGGRSSSKFFRDLLLLVNNALIFFGKKSTEAKAANDLRQFVTKEIVSQRHGKSTSATRKQVLLQSLSTSKKEAPETSDSLTLKPRISGSMIVCRKRSSITGKKSGADKEKEQQQEKDTKQQHSQQSESSADEPRVTNKRTRDRFTSTLANTKKNSKSQSNKNSVAEKQQGKGGGSSSSSQPSEPKNDNKKSQSTTTFDSSKKRGAANFLNRMKQGSSSPSNNNGALLDALKNRPLTSKSTTSKRGSSSEQKKIENSKKKEGLSKRNTTEMSQTKEKDSPGKRNVGRPPKRGAAAATSRKRGRENAEMESPPAKQQPKKRTRKL